MTGSEMIIEKSKKLYKKALRLMPGVRIQEWIVDMQDFALWFARLDKDDLSERAKELLDRLTLMFYLSMTVYISNRMTSVAATQAASSAAADGFLRSAGRDWLVASGSLAHFHRTT